jgi:hypothetical protein
MMEVNKYWSYLKTHTVYTECELGQFNLMFFVLKMDSFGVCKMGGLSITGIFFEVQILH